MKIAALKSALSDKAANKQIIIVEGLDKIKKPKTSQLAAFLEKVTKNLRNINIVLDTGMNNAQKSIENLPYASGIDASNISTYQVIKARTLILSSQSLATLKKRLVK